MRFSGTLGIVLISMLYVAAQLVADVGILREISIAGVAVGAFSLIYPFIFTLRDMAQKLAGEAFAYRLIFSAAAIALLAQLAYWLYAALPPSMTTEESAVMGLLLPPTLRIVIAATFATVLSQLLDTRIYSWWAARFADARQWGRVLFSNVISIPVDRALFVLIAFAGATDAAGLWELFLISAVIRALVGMLAIPAIYLVDELGASEIA